MNHVACSDTLQLMHQLTCVKEHVCCGIASERPHKAHAKHQNIARELLCTVHERMTKDHILPMILRWNARSATVECELMQGQAF